MPLLHGIGEEQPPPEGVGAVTRAGFASWGCLLPFQGADLAFAGGLSPLQGADAQVETDPKWRNDVGVKPLLLAVSWISSPLKRR